PSCSSATLRACSCGTSARPSVRGARGRRAPSRRATATLSRSPRRRRWPYPRSSR
ncbi:unnamed protein product, partial [Ectocarpus sp. 13 AM-2016]